MDFYSILEFAQLKAIGLAFEPTIESLYRIKCRQFSEQFHTPLAQVYEMDPLFVMGELYEAQYPPSILEEEGGELLERLYKIRDPNYRAYSREETEAMVDSVLNHEIARAAKKKKRMPTSQTIQEEIKKAESKPKSGGLDFSDLEKIESQIEAPKSGFKD